MDRDWPCCRRFPLGPVGQKNTLCSNAISDVLRSPSFGPAISELLDRLSIGPRYIYLHDFGAPVGLHIAIQAPERVLGLIVQNANAHRTGFGPTWAGMQAYAHYVARFDAIAEYLSRWQPPSLLLRGRHDAFFDLAEILSWMRDLPRMEAHVFDAGHLLLETHPAAARSLMLVFITRTQGASCCSHHAKSHCVR